MSAIFAGISALIVAAVMLYTVSRFAPGRDFWYAFCGYSLILLSSGVAGASAVLMDFTSMPPRFMIFLVTILSVSLFIILSPWGTRISRAVPLRALIALQGFRVLPEVLLDLSWRDGLAPVQMTWHGRNLDILSALLGLALGLAWKHVPQPRRWAVVYTVIGLGLLMNIVSVAVLSAPLPFRVFMNEPANTFVARFPYIWLPAIHVLTAIVLHGLAIRSLRRGSL